VTWQVEWLTLLENICKKLTHMHKMVILGGVSTFTNEKVLELIWINSELKMRRKEQIWRVRGLENALELVANVQPFLGVAPPFPVCTGHPTAVAPPP
jgi:hypothetical protein